MNKLFLMVVLVVVSISNSFAADGFSAGGYSHNVILSKGSLYVAGNNYYGEIVQPNDVKEYKTFIKLVDKVDAISANYSRTAFISKSKLYYFGWRASTTDTVTPTFISNNVSDVSLTNTNIYYIANKKVYEFAPKTNTTKELGMTEEPVKLATGTSHLVVLTKFGNVWTYGSNSVGQLCSGDTVNKTAPVGVFHGCNTISCRLMYNSIAANGNNTYMVTPSGEVKACGDNTMGQFGLNSTSPSSINVPTLIPNATNVKKVAPTTSGVYILRNDGLVDLIGWHNYIGAKNKPYNRSLTVYTMTVLNQITDIGTGNDTIYIKDSSGTIAWGGNMSSKLGDGTNIERHSPVTVILPEKDKTKYCTKDLPCNDDKDYK